MSDGQKIFCCALALVVVALGGVSVLVAIVGDAQEPKQTMAEFRAEFKRTHPNPPPPPPGQSYVLGELQPAATVAPVECVPEIVRPDLMPPDLADGSFINPIVLGPNEFVPCECTEECRAWTEKMKRDGWKPVVLPEKGEVR